MLSPWANIDSQHRDAFHRYLLILLHTRPCAGDTAVQEVCHPREPSPLSGGPETVSGGREMFRNCEKAKAARTREATLSVSKSWQGRRGPQRTQMRASRVPS